LRFFVFLVSRRWAMMGVQKRHKPQEALYQKSRRKVDMYLHPTSFQTCAMAIATAPIQPASGVISYHQFSRHLVSRVPRGPKKNDGP
jgi:hypothetical protein